MDKYTVTLEVTVVVEHTEGESNMDACTTIIEDIKTRFPDNWTVTINSESCTIE